jgi:tetratricopeptide (TPR) repeat protein
MAGRAPTAFRYQYKSEFMEWTRRGHVWEEKSPKGAVKILEVVRQEQVDGRTGSVVMLREDKNFRMFVSNIGELDPQIYFWANDKQQWRLLGRMKDIRLDEALDMQAEVLASRRQLLGLEHPDTLIAMNDVANSYADAGRLAEALQLWAESSARLPNDTSLALKIAALQAWFGKDADHAVTSRRVLKLAARTDDASTAERAAKAYCLRPSADPQLIESALTLARRAVELGRNDPNLLPWNQMTLGMAEYRHGSFQAAHQALSAAEIAGKENPLVQGPARLFHAMVLFRQGKETEARRLFAEAEAQMKPLPNDAMQPLANGAGPDDVVFWLAYKEAKALLETKTIGGSEKL